MGEKNKSLKMLERWVESMEDEYAEGIELLARGKNNAALHFFEKRMDNNHYLVHYGLATAKFKEKRDALTEPETRDIIAHYEVAMKQKPVFADAFLMCGMAYEQLAGVLMRAFKQHPYKNMDKQVTGIKAVLRKAKKLIEKAVELNPDFSDVATSELRVYKTRMRGIDNLKAHYMEIKHHQN